MSFWTPLNLNSECRTPLTQGLEVSYTQNINVFILVLYANRLVGKHRTPLNLMSEVSCSKLMFGGFQKLLLELETGPHNESFRIHSEVYIVTFNNLSLAQDYFFDYSRYGWVFPPPPKILMPKSQWRLTALFTKPLAP